MKLALQISSSSIKLELGNEAGRWSVADGRTLVGLAYEKLFGGMKDLL